MITFDTAETKPMLSVADLNLIIMTCTEFKIRVSEIIIFSNEAERKRYFKISNKELKRAGVNFKNMSTDKEIKEGWWKFNKHQADWEAYCRKSRHEARMRRNDSYVDYSHLAYNGVADDF